MLFSEEDLRALKAVATDPASDPVAVKEAVARLTLLRELDAGA